jgi:hypothetical protein
VGAYKGYLRPRLVSPHPQILDIANVHLYALSLRYSQISDTSVDLGDLFLFLENQ